MYHCAQTVLMDQNRFLVIEKQCNWLSLVTSILLVTYNTVGASIAGIADFKQKLKGQVTVLLRGVKERYAAITTMSRVTI